MVAEIKNFLEAQGLYLIYFFIEKKNQRRWTLFSTDNATKNGINSAMIGLTLKAISDS